MLKFPVFLNNRFRASVWCSEARIDQPERQKKQWGDERKLSLCLTVLPQILTLLFFSSVCAMFPVLR